MLSPQGKHTFTHALLHAPTPPAAAQIAAATLERLLESRERASPRRSSPTLKLELIDAAVAAGYVATGSRGTRRGSATSAAGRWSATPSVVPTPRGLWDNSGHDGPVDVALFVAGVPIGACRWPRWTPQPPTRR